MSSIRWKTQRVSKLNCVHNDVATQTEIRDSSPLTFARADIAAVLSEPGLSRLARLVPVVPALLAPHGLRIGGLLVVDDLVYVNVPVIKLIVLLTCLLCTDRPQGPAHTLVTASAASALAGTTPTKKANW